MRVVGVFVCVLFGVFTVKAQFSSEEKGKSFSDEIKAPLHYGPFVDFIPEVEDSVIIARINSIKSDIPLRFDNKIGGFIDYFAVRNRDYTRKMIKRSEVYFPIIEEILAKNNMPQSLKYLAIVESGLDPTIKSWAGALGLWQFMPATGKSFSLDYDAYIDERQNPYKSTEAACKYLKDLYRMFGDWELALGAYNCGPGNMRKAIRNSGGKTTFADVYNYLPKETRSYVPQFMAVNYVMRFAPEHNLYVEDWDSEFLPASDTIILNHYLDLNKLCDLTGVCSEHFKRLNPEIKKNTISESWSNYPLIIPKELAILGKDSIRALLLQASVKDEQAEKEAIASEKPATITTTSKIKHKVKSGESLGLIANKYNVSVTDLKKWNGIKGSTIHPGQYLTINKQQTTTVKSTTTTTTTTTTVKETAPVTIKEGSTTYYVVKSGDILSSVASRNNTTISELKKLNNLSGDQINVGQRLAVAKGAESVSSTEPTVKETVTTTKETSTKVEELKTYYVVKKGDFLGTIASRNNVSVSELKQLNGLKSDVLHVGQKLLVKVSEKAVVVKPVIQEKSTTFVEGTNTYYKVKSGDNLNTIAADNSISLDQLKSWNNLNSNEIQVGQKLIVKKGVEVKSTMKVETPVDKTPIKATETYAVQSGESLYLVAKKFNMSIAELKAINNLSSDNLSSGQKLQVYSGAKIADTKTPVSKTHVVKSGESLWVISQKYNVSVDEIKKLNNLKGNDLNVGQELKLN